MQLEPAILGHEGSVEAGHNAYRRVNPERGVLKKAVARHNGLGHLVSLLARRIDDSFGRTACIPLHEVQLNGAEVRRNSAQKVWRNRHMQSHNALTLAIHDSAQARQRERVSLLQESGKRSLASGTYFVKERNIVRETNTQSRKFTVMDGVRLRRQDTFRFFLGYPRGERFVRNSNVLRDIGNHFDAVVNVFMKEVGPQLRIQNAACQK